MHEEADTSDKKRHKKHLLRIIEADAEVAKLFAPDPSNEIIEANQLALELAKSGNRIFLSPKKSEPIPAPANETSQKENSQEELFPLTPIEYQIKLVAEIKRLKRILNKLSDPASNAIETAKSTLLTHTRPDEFWQIAVNALAGETIPENLRRSLRPQRQVLKGFENEPEVIRLLKQIAATDRRIQRKATANLFFINGAKTCQPPYLHNVNPQDIRNYEIKAENGLILKIQEYPYVTSEGNKRIRYIFIVNEGRCVIELARHHKLGVFQRDSTQLADRYSFYLIWRRMRDAAWMERSETPWGTFIPNNCIKLNFPIDPKNELTKQEKLNLLAEDIKNLGHHRPLTPVKIIDENHRPHPITVPEPPQTSTLQKWVNSFLGDKTS